MGFREDTDILNRMSIQEVAGCLGLQIPVRKLAHCPFPDHDDTDPSFRIWSPGNRWSCFGCDRHGGAIDFVKYYTGTDFLAARQLLADRVPHGTTFSVATQRSTAFEEFTDSSLPRTESPPDSDLYNTVLDHAPLHLSGREYLRRRGLSDATVSRSRIGQLPNTGNLLRDLISMYGFQRIKAAGMLTRSSTARKAQLIFPQQSLLFPFFENGELVYLQVRLLHHSTTGERWRNLSGRKRRIYNIDAISPIKHNSIAICEGVIDTLSAAELGLDAIGFVGVNMRLSENNFRQLRRKHVTILFDWDPAGESRAAALQQELRRHGITSTRKGRPLPSVNDVNDYLKISKSKP